jgi:hypothetical protein
MGPLQFLVYGSNPIKLFTDIIMKRCKLVGLSLSLTSTLVWYLRVRLADSNPNNEHHKDLIQPTNIRLGYK